MRFHSLALGFLVLFPLAAAAQDIAVRVERRGETVVVDVEAHVAAPLTEAWAVFTDYENMAGFISNLTASKVLSRTEHSLEVMQSGRTQVGFLSFGFEAVRAVELVPMREIRSSLVSGDFKAYDSITSLASSPAEAQRRIPSWPTPDRGDPASDPPAVDLGLHDC